MKDSDRAAEIAALREKIATAQSQILGLKQERLTLLAKIEELSQARQYWHDLALSAERARTG